MEERNNAAALNELMLTNREVMITDAEMEMIKKKENYTAGAALLRFIIVLMIIVDVILAIFDPKDIVFMIVATLFIIFMSRFFFNITFNGAYYATVTEKTTRYYTRGSRRNQKEYINFENTFEEADKKKYITRQLYFCNVEINGTVYENICCFSKDHDNIEIGDTVIVSLMNAIPHPIVYATSYTNIQ